MFRCWLLALGYLTLLLCGCDTEVQCTELQPAGCLPLFEPTYEAVFENTLVPSCGQGGVACHATEGQKGGFVVSDIETTYSALIDEGRVLPNDASCSPLVFRTETNDAELAMPPGVQLSEAERCAIQAWINAGAKR